MKTNFMHKTLSILMMSAMLFTVSCEKKDKVDPQDPIDQGGTEPAIILDCNYFSSNPNAVLKDNPNAPVDYLVTCRIDINDDVTIEPGVVIEFEKNTGIVIRSEGSLKAIGSSDKKIVFRGTRADKGHWDGIYFSYSTSINNIFDHVEVSDGGGRAGANRSQGGVVVYAESYLVLKNSTLKNNQKHGYSGSIASFNTGVVENNKFINNEYPVLMNSKNLDVFKNNQFIDNQNQVVLLRGEQVVEGDITWHKSEVPYRLENGFDMGAKLTIAPGVNVQMPQNGIITIREDGGGIIAVGTAAEPIIFTSTTHVPKAWRGINIGSRYAGNTIAHTEIHYSGMSGPATNIYLWYDAVLNIHDVKFKNIDGCAINWRYSTGNTPNPNLTMGANIEVDEGGCVDAVY